MKFRGFTLVEMVVAIAIFVIISVAIYGTIARFMEVNVDLSQRTEKLAKLNLFFTLLERDVHNFINRPVRGQYGDSLAAFESSSGSQGGNLLFEMTLSTPSWQEPASAILTRAGWFLRDHQIIRQSWEVLDRAQDSEPQEEVLLDNVDSVKLGYYIKPQGSKVYQIRPDWGNGAAPPGIAVTVNLVDGPSYTRVFDFVGG